MAGLAFPALQGVLDRAKRVRAKNDLQQLVTAVSAFNAEYGRYPLDIPSGGTAADAFFGTGTAPTGSTTYGGTDVLIDVLRNEASGANGATVAKLNPRGVVFLSVQTGWGSGINVLVDANYDDRLSNPYPDTDGSAGAAELRGGSIAFSYGRDGTKGSKGPNPPASANFKNSDDSISWR